MNSKLIMMEDLSICKICKKIFPDSQGLDKHKMTQHRQLIQLHEGTPQFRNNSISITRIPKETNPVQSTIIQNQNLFRKTAVPAVPGGVISMNVRRDIKVMKVSDGRPKPTFRSQDKKIKEAASSIQQMMGLTDDTTDWRKWEPHREREPVAGNVSGGTIITSSAAELATSAFVHSGTDSNTRGRQNLQGQQMARKSVPQLLRMPTNNGKRPAPGIPSQRTTPIAGSVRPATGKPLPGKPVPDILQNLGKMKTLCQPQSSKPNQSPKMISPLPGTKKATTGGSSVLPQKQLQVQPFRVNKTPQVSKSKGKILPRNAFNNALPKPGVSKGQQQEPDEVLIASSEFGFPVSSGSSSSEDDEDEKYTPSRVPQPRARHKPPPQAKKSRPDPPTSKSTTAPPPTNKSNVGGKISPQKSIHGDRFNSADAKKKPTTNTSNASRNGNSTQSVKSTSSPAKSSENGEKKPASTSTVVAKKSSPGKSSSKQDKLRYLKTYTITMPGTNYDMPKLSAVGNYTNRAGDQVWICLVCNQKEHEESSRDMICCDYCEDWYHWECVGISNSIPEDDPWYCKRCIFQVGSNPKKDFPKLFKTNVPPI